MSDAEGITFVIFVWAVIMSGFMDVHAARVTLAVTAAHGRTGAGGVAPAPRPPEVALRRKAIPEGWQGPLARAAERRYGDRAGGVVLALSMRARLGATGPARALMVGMVA